MANREHSLAKIRIRNRATAGLHQIRLIWLTMLLVFTPTRREKFKDDKKKITTDTVAKEKNIHRIR